MRPGRWREPLQFSGRSRVKDLAYGIDLAETALGKAAKCTFEKMAPLLDLDKDDSAYFRRYTN